MSKFTNFFKENWTPTIIITLFILVVVFGCALFKQSEHSLIKRNYALEIYHDNIELTYEGARAELVKTIDLVIREVAPTTCMNGLAILRGCEKYDVDLFFVLAQGQLESHYGTKGLAQKTNSVFNVFAYDGHNYDQITQKGKYEHPDLSIEPYLELISKCYLVNGKTEKDLMVEYVNESGKRYATSELYEGNLLGIYNKLMENDTLVNAYREYVKYKVLSGN